MRWGGRLIGIGLMLATIAPTATRVEAEAGPPACSPGGGLVVLSGSVSPTDAKTYRNLPFEVSLNTTRVEVGYQWTDNVPLPGTPANVLVQTVLDLGLWDASAVVGDPQSFRGWSGSRQGRLPNQRPVWVQANTAERGYRPGPVEPGIWHVDLGIAAVAPQGATYTVTVRCTGRPVDSAFVSQPVAADHVANESRGWYHGDFHMHGRHSKEDAPEWEDTLDVDGDVLKKGFITYATEAGLDFLPVTDYVTDQHQRELGPVQAANPDLLIWPGREIITYYGHATVFGETPSVVDWRHGAGAVSLSGIQAASVGDGALFGIAHPTIFPTPVFGSFCRGCEFTLDDKIDWSKVTTTEVLTGPILVNTKELNGPEVPYRIQNPFVTTALDYWHRHLLAGHKITAVSGSDDKAGPGLGSSATAVYASELSRLALIEAVKAGHAYVRTQGAKTGPTLEMTAATRDGTTGMFGDTLAAGRARVTVTVQGANGQRLMISRDGLPAGSVPITSDDFTHTFTATRIPTSGPLGTFWRVDTLAPATATNGPYLTTIGNPIFLKP